MTPKSRCNRIRLLYWASSTFAKVPWGLEDLSQAACLKSIAKKDTSDARAAARVFVKRVNLKYWPTSSVLLAFSCSILFCLHVVYNFHTKNDNIFLLYKEKDFSIFSSKTLAESAVAVKVEQWRQITRKTYKYFVSWFFAYI